MTPPPTDPTPDRPDPATAPDRPTPGAAPDRPDAASIPEHPDPAATAPDRPDPATAQDRPDPAAASDRPESAAAFSDRPNPSAAPDRPAASAAQDRPAASAAPDRFDLGAAPGHPETAVEGPGGVAAADHEVSEERAAGVLGLLMLVGAVVVLVDAATLRSSDAAVGPAAVPTVLGVLLGVLGGALAFRARRSLRTAKIRPRSWWRLAALVGALIAFAVLLPVLGYVVCSAALFVAAALLLGAPHPGRIVATGWTLAVLVFVLFHHVVGLSLPTGPWGF